ncbi:hypothetical protein [Paraburkholderia youngii]|uniref:hypothetical protein n=1 Tax=Paraburkholderia youngii TaxID=2782701 RepID=UPI003D1FAD63
MITAPVWTGSGWTAPVCKPVAATPQDEANACGAILGYPGSQLKGPLTGSGMDQFNAIISQYTNMGFYNNNVNVSSGSPGSPATNDLFYPSGEFPPSDFCWVQPGTTNVTGKVIYGWCSPNGGAAVCGGGGY